MSDACPINRKHMDLEFKLLVAAVSQARANFTWQHIGQIGPIATTEYLEESKAIIGRILEDLPLYLERIKNGLEHHEIPF